jgi:lipoprotein-anchoring transpeptidase ErfK/SrfK
MAIHVFRGRPETGPRRFMAGGATNPLGARALYLGDTLYRIHGTNQAVHHWQLRVLRLHPADQ